MASSIKNIICIVGTVGVIIISTKPSAAAPSCRLDAKRQSEASAELQKIVADDQSDRTNNNLKPGAAERDRERRTRVGALFGEGCLRTAADFAAAALVYQHGDVPEHFLQTYIWAKRSIELGDKSQQRLMAQGIDRYLVNTGRKQLFASQALRRFDDNCRCLHAVEPTFPESLRKSIFNKTLKEQFAWVYSESKDPSCPKENVCIEEPALKETPVGSIPGLW